MPHLTASVNHPQAKYVRQGNPTLTYKYHKRLTLKMSQPYSYYERIDRCVIILRDVP